MERNKAYAVVFFVQCVYAGMALLSKAAISKGMNPYVFVAYRQAFATTALAPFALLVERNKSCPLSYTLFFKIFLVSLFGITLSLNLYYYAITYTSATYAAATTNMIPAITFIIAFLFGLETIHIKQWSGVAKIMGTVMGVCGALMFAFVKGPSLNIFQTHQNLKSNNSKGDHEWVKGSLIMLLANTAWSLWLVIQVPIIKQYPMKLRLTTLQCLLSCLQSVVVAVAMTRDVSAWKIGWDVHLIAVAYCGVVVTGITYWLQVWVIEKKGPVFTAIFTPLALLITAVFSELLWNEMFHLGSVCGMLLLVGGLYGVLWGKSRERKLENIEQKTEEIKEDTILECITTSTHYPILGKKEKENGNHDGWSFGHPLSDNSGSFLPIYHLSQLSLLFSTTSLLLQITTTTTTRIQISTTTASDLQVTATTTSGVQVTTTSTVLLQVSTTATT